MNNSLRYIRTEKGITLREAGEGMKIPFQTLAVYEKQEAPLKPDVLELAAKFYNVSVESIEKPPPSEPNTVTEGIALDVVPLHILKDLVKALSAKLPNSGAVEQPKILSSLTALTQEINRRGATGEINKDAFYNEVAPGREEPLLDNQGMPVSDAVQQAARKLLRLAMDQVTSESKKQKSK